jgi:hypothetical protein
MEVDKLDTVYRGKRANDGQLFYLCASRNPITPTLINICLHSLFFQAITNHLRFRETHNLIILRLPILLEINWSINSSLHPNFDASFHEKNLNMKEKRKSKYKGQWIPVYFLIFMWYTSGIMFFIYGQYTIFYITLRLFIVLHSTTIQ